MQLIEVVRVNAGFFIYFILILIFCPKTQYTIHEWRQNAQEIVTNGECNIWFWFYKSITSYIQSKTPPSPAEILMTAAVWATPLLTRSELLCLDRSLQQPKKDRNDRRQTLCSLPSLHETYMAASRWLKHHAAHGIIRSGIIYFSWVFDIYTWTLCILLLV